jgi:hypothetical protein
MINGRVFDYDYDFEYNYKIPNSLMRSLHSDKCLSCSDNALTDARLLPLNLAISASNPGTFSNLTLYSIKVIK